MRDDICVLLTSAIEVKNKHLVKRHDTATRLEDYKRALRSWLTKQTHVQHIVFVDNSGYPLDTLKHIAETENVHGKHVEFLSFHYDTTGDSDISLGEIAILDYALTHSQTLANTSYFIKCTGRVFVENIDSLVQDLPETFHAVARFSENLSYIDSVIMIFETRMYREDMLSLIAQTMKQPNGKTDFERAYAKVLHELLAKDYQWFPFSHEPIFSGMSGTKNQSYRKKYGRFQSLWYSFISHMFYKRYRTSWGKSSGREHLLVRWNIQPERGTCSSNKDSH